MHHFIVEDDDTNLSFYTISTVSPSTVSLYPGDEVDRNLITGMSIPCTGAFVDSRLQLYFVAVRLERCSLSERPKFDANVIGFSVDTSSPFKMNKLIKATWDHSDEI